MLDRACSLGSFQENPGKRREYLDNDDSWTDVLIEKDFVAEKRLTYCLRFLLSMSD